MEESNLLALIVPNLYQTLVDTKTLYRALFFVVKALLPVCP